MSDRNQVVNDRKVLQLQVGLRRQVVREYWRVMKRFRELADLPRDSLEELLEFRRCNERLCQLSLLHDAFIY